MISRGSRFISGGGALRFYTGMQALCHWHPDLELIYVLSGEMNYSVNGQTMLLKTGDCLLVASRQMHFGYHNQRQDCEFVCVLFHPDLFSGNARILEDYVMPVAQGPAFLHVPGDETLGRLMQELLREKEMGEAGYELEALGLLSLVLGRLYRKVDCGQEMPPMEGDLRLQRDMVSFITQHYTETITLSRIAAAANVSRSKCCQVFQKYLGQSPVEFLNSYRLEVSGHLLMTTSSSVSEIALACGFNHLSYFSKLFARKYGCSPREYRKQLLFRENRI